MPVGCSLTPLGNISSCCEQGATFTADTYILYFIILHEWTYILTQVQESPCNKPTTPTLCRILAHPEGFFRDAMANCGCSRSAGVWDQIIGSTLLEGRTSSIQTKGKQVEAWPVSGMYKHVWLHSVYSWLTCCLNSRINAVIIEYTLHWEFWVK